MHARLMFRFARHLFGDDLRAEPREQWEAPAAQAQGGATLTEVDAAGVHLQLEEEL